MYYGRTNPFLTSSGLDAEFSFVGEIWIYCKIANFYQHPLLVNHLHFTRIMIPKTQLQFVEVFCTKEDQPQELSVMIWPSQSPIEVSWDDSKTKGRRPQNAKQLWEYLQKLWQQIDSNYLGKN